MDEGSFQTLSRKSLPDLSSELLLQILSEVASTSFYSLSLTNQRLHHIANPRLYESLYFWGTGNKDTTERCFESGDFGELYDTEEAPLGASRVFSLDRLAQTLQQSPRVASYLKKVELTWGADQDTKDDKVVLRFLDIIKTIHLESLVLYPPSLYFQVPAHAAVTTLRTRHEGHSGGLDEDIYPDIDQLHKQCCIPSLKEISVNGWLYWGSPPEDIRISSVDLVRAKTSPITTLRMSSLGAPGHTFEDILSWPKNLRVFHFMSRPEIGCGKMYQMDSRIVSADFIRPLQQCIDTLEELSIRCFQGVKDCAELTSKPLDFKNFSALRRLCIRHDFLLMDRYSHNCRSDPRYDGNPPRLHKVLPSSLEKLDLEIADDNFSMSAESEDVYWMFNLLEDLAMHKTEFLPRLRTVIARGCVDFFHHLQWSKIVSSCERGAEVRAVFARENIKFSDREIDIMDPGFDT